MLLAIFSVTEKKTYKYILYWFSLKPPQKMYVCITANLTDVIEKKKLLARQALHVKEGQFRASLSLAATDQMIAFIPRDAN